jgi:hypothetical protein
LVGVAGMLLAWTGGSAAAAPLPERLSGTGLYEPGTLRVRAGNLPFSPQYPLWSDGAAKRRWIFLPPDGAIDARDADAWQFPPGTRLWKEFAYAGRPVETRYIERTAEGDWRFAAYVWDEDGDDARLAPPRGLPRHPAAAAPGGVYTIPGELDCRACHEGAATPVLGFSALQLSPDRDALAAHAEPLSPDHVDLPALARRGLVRNLAPALLALPPRIAAPAPTARAALGYLHGNCGHCHNDAGPLATLDFSLAQSVRDPARSLDRLLLTTQNRPSEFLPDETVAGALRIAAGRPDHSILALRMRARSPALQMPPLGTRIADQQGLALVEQWIRQDMQ